MLKFRYGKCYGDNTREILKVIRSKGLFKKPLNYRPEVTYELDNILGHDSSQGGADYEREGVPQGGANHFMTGYTGYIPGMFNRYGTSYHVAADECMSEFHARQRKMRDWIDFTKSYISSTSAPNMETVHSRDEIRRNLYKFKENYNVKDNTRISPEFPPIAGYTGHIPRLKGSEASLSKRYYCAAKNGLELINFEKAKREEMMKADTKLRAVLKNHGKRSSYWNWG